MDSMIEVSNGLDCVVYIIPQIKGIKLYDDKKSIGIVINEAGLPNVHIFNSESGAKNFYDDCLKKIEAFYQANMSNNDKIKALQEDANRAYTTVSNLANFINKLDSITEPGCQIARSQLPDAMTHLEEWVKKKARG